MTGKLSEVVETNHIRDLETFQAAMSELVKLYLGSISQRAPLDIRVARLEVVGAGVSVVYDDREGVPGTPSRSSYP